MTYAEHFCWVSQEDRYLDPPENEIPDWNNLEWEEADRKYDDLQDRISDPVK